MFQEGFGNFENTELYFTTSLIRQRYRYTYVKLYGFAYYILRFAQISFLPFV